MPHPFQNQLLRWKTVLQDRLRYGWIAQLALGLFYLCLGVVHGSSPRGLSHRARAHRIFLPLGASFLTEPFLRCHVPAASTGKHPANLWMEHRIDWERCPDRQRDGHPLITHGLIIKPPVSEREKGILVLWVDYNLLPVLKSPRLIELLAQYEIVFSTAWSPPDFPFLWALAGFPEADLHVIPSNPRDEAWLHRIPCNLRVLPFFASHWLEGRVYDEYQGAAKTQDLVVVSNWAPFKRHWTLFRALAQMPKDLRIALVGQPQGNHTVESAQRLARSFGVRQHLDWRNREEMGEVHRLQATSHASIILSLREGSCLVVAESLLAGVPVGMLRKAHIGSSAFIQEKTGVFLDESRLARDLTNFLERARNGDFHPREWAIGHIDARTSSAKLNELLREDATRRGRAWTRDIHPFCLRGAVPDFLDPAQCTEAHAWHRSFENTYHLRFPESRSRP